MFLRHKPSGDLVEVLNIHDLFDPCLAELEGRFHAGEEMQDPQTFRKTNLVFPSGEKLPLCWVDPDYRVRGILQTPETQTV